MSDTQLPDSWIAYCAAFHELFPRSGNVELSAAAIQQFACNLTSAKEAELASLRHDIERAVQRNTELLAENFELQSSFDDEVTARERAEAERDAAVKDAERLDKANTELAQESCILRLVLGELVDAVNGTNDLDEMDGEEYQTASKRLDDAMAKAIPHTEEAIQQSFIDAAQKGGR